ncbi:MAG: hypothetical protein V3V78_02620 [Candidatus Woesearchaeota archaeon]
MVVNETINATAVVNATITELTFDRFMELVTAPYHFSALLWITIPLIVALILMDIYFGRYKKEELGWNTAVGNTLALVFVAMDLFRQVWSRLAEPSFWNLIAGHFRETMVIVVLALGSLWLFIADFLHILPKKLAFFISSSVPTSVFAYTAIVLIYTDIPLDKYTLLASVVLFFVLLIALKIIQFLIPTYYSKEEVKKMLKKSR